MGWQRLPESATRSRKLMYVLEQGEAGVERGMRRRSDAEMFPQSSRLGRLGCGRFIWEKRADVLEPEGVGEAGEVPPKHT